ncbi:6-phospho-3-hexuloisomerase [Actinomycetospora sp. C-140]
MSPGTARCPAGGQPAFRAKGAVFMSTSTSHEVGTDDGHDHVVTFDEAAHLITSEHSEILQGVDTDAWQRAATLMAGATGVFTVGTGRSGLALQMAAMRFMHLGKNAHVVGETTTPAIVEGDVLVAASGSGSTKRVVTAARTAADQGATVLALTTDPESDLADLATETLVVPAADKQDFDGANSSQYAGSLFEQSVLILTDALFHVLWQTSGTSARDLWRLHANLE